MEKTISLTENRLFRSLYARSPSCAYKTLAVYARKNHLKTVNRLGITVSVKLGGAVARNRMRRRLKEAYRLSEHTLKSGYDIVIVARFAAYEADFSAIERDLSMALTRLGVTVGGQNG